MHRTIFAILAFMLLITPFILSGQADAASAGMENMSKAKAFVDQALIAAKQDLQQSKDSYDQFQGEWMDEEDTVKADSQAAYKDIEMQMGQIEYAYLQNNPANAAQALQALQQLLDRYIHGQYAAENMEQQPQDEDTTLPGFLTLLKQTKAGVLKHDQSASLSGITHVRAAWLSVEGNVVAQSASVYNDSERDMVVVNAMIADRNYDGAAKLLDTMLGYLSPLAEKLSYSIWDAAMIPLREGLEALLVVGALLAFVKKSKDGKGKRWVWSGVIVGFLLSAALAVAVKLVFSVGAFGTNNFLIAGWTGIFAAAMLLYMSYWLHSKSNIQQWNRYIQTKTQTALSTGRVISLGILSFLAVFREGTETVLFIIGMANQISVQKLLLGILIGFGILAVIAFLMLFVGMRLPIRPFFLVSSLIVFYLCVKFTGLGIHSLQLAGALPASHAYVLPSIDILGFFPSWQSALPQVIITLITAVFLGWSALRKRQNKNVSAV